MEPRQQWDALDLVKATGEIAGPHVAVDRAAMLHHAIVPPYPAGLDHLAGRIALTVDEAAPALGVSVRLLRSAIASGDVPSMMLKGRRLIPLKALERHIEALAYAESGAMDAWESAIAKAASTRLGRARRQAFNARKNLKRRAKEVRRMAADLKDSPGAAREVAAKVVAELAAAESALTVEQRIASDMGRGLHGDIADLRREFNLTEGEVLEDERPVG